MIRQEREVIRQDREEAVERESQLAVRQFIERSQKRNWSLDDFALDEIREWGHMLSPTTVTLAEAFMGIEAQLPNYLSEGSGLGIFKEGLDRWGFEEARHEPTLKLVLIHSGVRTEGEIAEYKAKVLQHPWSVSEHQGLQDPLDAIIFGMFQERGTYVNYRGLLHLIRRDYGLPQNLTDEERKRGYQIGAAEAVDTVSKDELGHHVIDLQLVRIHMKYFPDETRAKIREVKEGFKMPALSSLPNRHEFVQALRSTRIYDGRVYQQQVVEPTLRSLGLV